MKNEIKIREVLIKNTIQLVAEGGFEKATTKAITFSKEDFCEFKMNESYIYRFFGGKDQLYAACFDYIDRDFIHSLQKAILFCQSIEATVTEKLYELFLQIWRYLLINENNIRYYIRYYYSCYFSASYSSHNSLYEDVIRYFTPLFSEECDVRTVLHSALASMLDFAVRVYNGDLKNNNQTKAYVFNALYSAMSIYFNDSLF